MIETLDVRTLILILTLGHAIAALLLFFATLKRAQIYDTVFMISMALQAAGWMLLFFRGTISDILSFSVGNTLIFCGFCLEGIALLSLVRHVNEQWQKYFAAILALSLVIIWLPLPGQDQNVGFVSFVIPLFFLFPGIFLIFSAPYPSPLKKFTGSILLLYIIAVMARGIFLLVAKDYSLLQPTFFQVVFLSGQFIIMALASTGYILIRRELVSADLEDEIEERLVIEAELKDKTDSLQERVKELNCLYEIARLIETTPSDEALFQTVSNILPAGWRYPDQTSARITLKSREFLSEGFQTSGIKQESILTIYGKAVGSIEIFFLGEPAVYGKNPFLSEEFSLIFAVGERISRMLERHWSEVTLRESEEKYRRLFEQVSDAIFIADITTRRLTDCNKKAEILTGYTRDEILLMTADELHPPDIRVRTVERFRDFLDGKPGIIETEVITKEGQRVPVSINATPLEFGGSRYLVGIFRDITWQKEVEKTIAERTEEVDRFFTTSLDLFCIADTSGYFRRLNPEWEKVLGWPVADLEGKPFLDYVHPDDLQATLDAMQELENQNDVTAFINRYRHQDGSWRWIEWRSAPSGTRIFAAARDITRHYLDEHYNAGLSSLKQELLISAPLEDKLRMITDVCVSLFNADFARIWMVGPGDLCNQGCIHAGVTEGLTYCPDRTACLHLMVSSGRYSHTDGDHHRVPFGAFMIGRIATGEEPSFITNDVVHDSRVHNHVWASSLGLVSFAGFRLISAEGRPMGVLAFFSRQQISLDMLRYFNDLAATTSQVIQAAKAGEALRESEERFRRLISRSFDAVVVHQDGRIVLVNESTAHIMGASGPEELVGKPVIDLVHPDDRKAVAERIQEMLTSKEGTVPLMEERFIRLDGIPITVSVMATKTKHNGRSAVLVMFRDITRQKEAEQALETAKQFSDTIIDSIPGIFYVFDETGHFIRRNPNHQMVTGYSDDELHEITALDTIAPEDRDLIAGIINNVFNQQGFTTVTVNVLTKSGKKIPYLLGGLSMTVSGKKYLVGTGIDITEQVRAEEALRESEDRFSRAIAGTGAGLWDWDMVNDIVFFSSQWKSMLGYEDDEIENNFSGWKDLWHPDDVTRIEKAITDYLEGRTIFYEIEHRLRHKDGSWHWILTRGDIHRDKTGRAIRWVGTNIDITRMKGVEEELSRSRQMLQLVIDTIPQRVFWKDTNSVYLGCNLPLAQDAGYSDPHDLIGKDDYATASKAMADQYRADDRMVMETGVSRLNYEEKQVKPDGSRAWLTTSKVPLRDNNGTVIGVLGTYEDITSRKLMEQALRESEEKFREMFENIQDFVYQADMEGNFIMVNPAGVRMLGYDSMDQMVGRPVTDAYANPDDRKTFLKAHEPTGSLSAYPMTLKSRCGTILHVIASSHYFYDANGVRMGIEGVIHDLTDLHRAEEGLRMANHKLNLLSSITRHDIMNQLQALNGYIDLSTESLGDPDTLAGYVAREEIIAQNIQRQIEFTRDYEDLGVKSPVWQDVSKLVQDVSQALLMQDIQMITECPVVEVFADPLLYKVFYNLTDNALHYGGGKMTQIHLKAYPQNENLIFTFEDDGEGISTLDKQKLFTRGFGKHTGLGLFLSREILAITGITITENGEPGKGARFEITVPNGKWRVRE